MMGADMYPVKIAFLSLLSLLVMYTNSYPFDIDGIKDGMSQKAVMNIIQEWNFDKIENGDGHIRAYDDQSGERFYVFNFCHDELYFLQKNRKASMKEFIILFDKFKGKYGQPIDSHTNSSPQKYDKDRSIQYSIHFIWKTKSDLICLNYTIYPKNDQLYVIYEVYNSCYGNPYFR